MPEVMQITDELIEVTEVESEIQAIMQVKFRRWLIWMAQGGPKYLDLLHDEIAYIRKRFPIASMSKNYKPTEPVVLNNWFDA